MKKLIQMIILLNCCLLSFIATAQTTIRGTVKDNAGGLPGVSIQEKNGKGNGTSTNETGEFGITLKGNSNILEVTAIGYLKQEVNVAGKTTVNITLKEDTKGLEEVVVIGFGTAKKITNTGAISTISAADVRTTPTPNI